MNFKDLAFNRFSVRNFQPKSVEKEKLNAILEAAILAPSAVNFQPWTFVVVTEASLLEQLHSCYHRDWFKTAPACIVAIGNHEEGWHRPTDGKDYTDMDVAIAIDHLMLAAAEAGLGTCWICHFNAEKCAELFDLPAHLEPIAMIPVGYPAVEVPATKKRKSFDEVVRWNQFRL
ncbi:MAG: nitroreductase family protein [Marinilabiliales bacterium]|nr:nitroreductase family protein [Marinilabiliales bacterium]